MHPQIIAMAAAEHVKDMQASAIRGRRAREARRARRGAIALHAGRPVTAGRLLPAASHAPAAASKVPAPRTPAAAGCGELAREKVPARAA